MQQHLYLLAILSFNRGLFSFNITELIEKWIHFKQVNGIVYNNLSENYKRMMIFEKNIKKIEEHNKRYEQGLESFSLKSHCKYADRLNSELQSRRRVQQHPHNKTRLHQKVTKLPIEKDWRKLGAVTKVRDSGSKCGSCYSITATGVLEAQYFLKTGKLEQLSIQQIIDCSKPNGNEGCEGGNIVKTFRYATTTAIVKEEDYPYTEKDNACQMENKIGLAKVKDFVRILKDDEDNLKEAVAEIGPVAASLHATELYFDCYEKGVLNDKTCSTQYKDLNHAVLVVGYGVEDGQEYWLVKNDWGEKWGMGGYAKLARNSGNNCGIATASYYATIV